MFQWQSKYPHPAGRKSFFSETVVNFAGGVVSDEGAVTRAGQRLHWSGWPENTHDMGAAKGPGQRTGESKLLFFLVRGGAFFIELIPSHNIWMLSGMLILKMTHCRLPQCSRSYSSGAKMSQRWKNLLKCGLMIYSHKLCVCVRLQQRLAHSEDVPPSKKNDMPMEVWMH